MHEEPFSLSHTHTLLVTPCLRNPSPIYTLTLLGHVVVIKGGDHDVPYSSSPSLPSAPHLPLSYAHSQVTTRLQPLNRLVASQVSLTPSLSPIPPPSLSISLSPLFYLLQSPPSSTPISISSPTSCLTLPLYLLPPSTSFALSFIHALILLSLLHPVRKHLSSSFAVGQRSCQLHARWCV